jgi:hypothetical protein
VGQDHSERLAHSDMARRLIDPHATEIPRASRLVPSLYVPIAARDAQAIETYVGTIVQRSCRGSRDNALVVEAHEPEAPDLRMAIWKLPAATVLHHPRQLWVHVDFAAYRRAYVQAFPEIDLADFVLDHVMNRRVARLKGFAFLRIVPISRAANSSHGGLSECWAVTGQSSAEMRERNRLSKASVQYADLADIVKMLNMGGGGGVMDNVNAAQRLVAVPDGS